MAEYEARMAKYEGPELTRVAPQLKNGERELVPLFQDESCLSHHDYSNEERTIV
jgi:hypothetical protein